MLHAEQIHLCLHRGLDSIRLEYCFHNLPSNFYFINTWSRLLMCRVHHLRLWHLRENVCTKSTVKYGCQCGICFLPPLLFLPLQIISPTGLFNYQFVINVSQQNTSGLFLTVKLQSILFSHFHLPSITAINCSLQLICQQRKRWLHSCDRIPCMGVARKGRSILGL